METVPSSRKSTFAPIVVVVLVLYVGSYCWLRFGIAKHFGGYSSGPSLLYISNERWIGINADRLNFIFKPLLLADALISRKKHVCFVGERFWGLAE